MSGGDWVVRYVLPGSMMAVFVAFFVTVNWPRRFCEGCGARLERRWFKEDYRSSWSGREVWRPVWACPQHGRGGDTSHSVWQRDGIFGWRPRWSKELKDFPQ